MVTRTMDEIVARYRELSGSTDDFFGAEGTEILAALPFERAQEFLNDGTTSEQWDEARNGCDRTSTIKAMQEYMPFAWGKANDCRGLSAARSIAHLNGWMWLLGEPRFEDYEYYGKPQLRHACELYEIDWRQWDDGRWCEYEDGPGIKPESVPPLAIPAT